MSSRTRRVSLAALLAVGMAAIILGAIYFGSSREPSYQGKTLSEWIVPFCRQTPKGLDAPGGPQHFEELQPVRRAVSQMGTNALPFLIAKVTRRESDIHRTVRQLADKQPLAGLRLTDPHVGHIRAIRALAILGPAARPAIPSLVLQLPDPALSDHAVYALAGMGSDGMCALVDHFTNAAPIGRMQIAMTLVAPKSLYRGENAGPSETDQISAGVWIQGLCRIVQDSSGAFRIPAIQRLGTFGPAASNAVPVLLPILGDTNPMMRQMAIRALGEIKAWPESVVPALTNLLNDPNPGTQMAAASALRAFGYNAQLQPKIPDRSGMPGRQSPPAGTNPFRPQ